jgi:hypothetical protein
MDRRVLLAGLFGVAGTAALAAILPPQAEALAGMPVGVPPPGSSVLPNLEDLKTDPDAEETVSGVQLANHRRRRHRRWRWRRYCRREWWHGYWRRRCRRRRFAIWIWI